MPGRPVRRARESGQSAEDRARANAARFAALANGYLDQAFANLKRLAEGAVRVERKSAAAGTLMRKDVVRKADGSVWLDDKGKPAGCEVRANDLPFDQLVFVSEVETRLPPDVRALEFLVNRPLGTPRPAPEVEAELLEIRQALLTAIAAAAARKARPPVSDEPPLSLPAPADDDDD